MKDKKNKAKLISAKKLPKLFKKKYTEKALENKLLKKLDVPSDKELVKGLFLPYKKKPGLLAADLSLTLEKKQLKKFKKLAKDIKSRKFGFKLLPFAVTAGFLAALILGVILFKDLAVKKAISSALESIFDAKTDIGYAHIEILNSRLQVKNLSQASSDDDMKNLFQIADFTLDFNLTEALRGKVDIENITIGEVLFNTDRTKSGKLVKSKKADKAKTEKKNKNEKKSEGGQNKKQNDLMAKTQNTLSSMFADYNPENIMSNMESNLKSPAVADDVQKTASELVDKWKDQPAKIEKSVKEMTELTQSVQNFDYSKLSDPAKIKEMIELVNSAIKTGNEISDQTKTLVKDVDKDSAKIKELSSDIQKAIEADKKLAEAEIGKFTAFKGKGIKNVFNDMITAFVYGMADQYSPKARGYINKALQLKAKHDASAAKKNNDKKKAKKLKMKKRIAQRDAGRFVYYKEDKVPKFLLENASGSGEGWKLLAKEFSSDADKRDKQSLLEAAFTLSGIQNEVGAVIDARSNNENPLVKGTYDGKNIPTNVVIDSYGMKSKADLNCTALVAKSDSKVSGSGILNLSQIQIITPSFEPEIVYDIYKDTLDSIQKMKISFDYKWSEENDLSLDLTTDAGEVFQSAFTSSFNKALSKIANQAREKINNLLAEKTGIATDKISEFTDIEKVIKNSDKTVQNMKSELEGRKKELENMANGALDRAKKQAEAELAKAKAEAEAKAKAEAERLKKEAEEAAKKEAEKQAKNLLKGFGF